MSDPRLQKLAEWAASQLGQPVLWDGKGDYYLDANDVRIQSPPGVLVFDCSGFINYGVRACGGPDRIATHNAQSLWNLCPPFLEVVPEISSLGFWGHDDKRIAHIALAVAAGGIISADGATSSIRSLAEAMRYPDHRVRLHLPTATRPAWQYRLDLPFQGWRKNVLFSP